MQIKMHNVLLHDRYFLMVLVEMWGTWYVRALSIPQNFTSGSILPKEAESRNSDVLS